MARIVFDLDGTLIDSAPDIRGVANGLLGEAGLEPLTLEETRSFIGNGAGVLVEKMRAARGIDDSEHDRLLATFVDRYDAAVDLTVPYPGVTEALDSLIQAGHALGICTNKPVSPTHAVLRHLGLNGYFDTIWGGDSLPVRKPDPAPLLAALDALGAGQAVYVGDSEVDAETAEHAHVPFLLFTEGYRKSPVERIAHAAAFGSFEHLPVLVAELLSRA
ncbi:MAG: phosphoglycolate phosphatase [Pseudomonadota bacterium]|nr:phosphoglycolate phosphatase [Pseudomonadota bacterium]